MFYKAEVQDIKVAKEVFQASLDNKQSIALYLEDAKAKANDEVVLWLSVNDFRGLFTSDVRIVDYMGFLGIL